MEWHDKEEDELFQILDSSSSGLTHKEAEKRLSEYGPNRIREEESISKIEILIEQIKNPIVYIILITAIITFIFKKYTDTLVIGIVVIFNTIIGFIQEYKAESSLKALKLMVSPECTVLRKSQENGKSSEIRLDARNIVPGDILLLESGDKIPADARVINSINLEVDESMLTGESLSVNKNTLPAQYDAVLAERTNMVYAGTIVTKGRGTAVIVETGMNTEIGKIAELIQGSQREITPLQKKLGNLVKIFVIIALISSTITFGIGLFLGIEIYEMFFYAVASAISAIPEGLPIVMTITLAIGVNRMAKKNAIIRKLQAVDTLGASTIICTDKTGTLTTNQMTVRQMYANNQFIDVTGVGLMLQGEFEVNGEKFEIKEKGTIDLLLECATLCNNARLIHDDDEKVGKIYGDPTEASLLVLAAKQGIFMEDIEKKLPRIDEIPFNSSLKYMVTFHEKTPKKIIVYIKGAPEVVLGMCSHISINGKIQNLSEEKTEELVKDQQLRLMVVAKSVLRNLAFAYAVIDLENKDMFKKAIEAGEKVFNFLGLVGMIDPPRPTVKDSIEKCKKAGIKVIMATGDHKITAEAIGNELKIHQEGSSIFTGTDLKDMSEKELDEKIDHTSIFARVSPEDKFKIVNSLKRKNHVVCMTGDGVNDAPALKEADVGIAMGKTGTDVAKEASEMVLTDDDFSNIVDAVEEGRVIFQNIRKVIKYLICTNIGEDAVILVSLFLFPLIFGEIFLIFTPVQILWVNLVTDGLLDVTLAMEGKESDVMAQDPRDPEEPIFNRNIILNILFIGTLMMLGTLFMFIYGMNRYNLRIKAQTIAFTTMAMFQVFNALNCRSRSKSLFELGPFSNRYLIGAIFISIILQICAVSLPLFNILLGTTPLSILDWLSIMLIASSVFIGDEIRKLFQKQLKK